MSLLCEIACGFEGHAAAAQVAVPSQFGHGLFYPPRTSGLDWHRLGGPKSSCVSPLRCPKSSFSKEEVVVLRHWISFAEDFQFASADCYAAVEKYLDARQVPGLEKSRVEFAEDGILSDRRVCLTCGAEH